MKNKLFDYQKNHLVDIKEYEECSLNLKKILSVNTINFFLFFAESENFHSFCDSNINTIQSNIIFEPPIFKLVKTYMYTRIAWSSFDILEKYMSVSNYVKVKASSDVWYHFFSVNALISEIASSSSLSEPTLMYIPKMTAVIVSCDVIQINMLYEPFRDISYNYFNKKQEEFHLNELIKFKI